MIILQLPWALSVNSAYRVFQNRVILSAKGRSYRKIVVSEVLRQLGGQPEAMTGRLSVSAEFYPPDKRKRDLDNHWKSLLDALTHAKVWEDDSQIDYLLAKRGHKVPAGMVIVTIEQLYSEERANE
jgi:crossover junction endodeoxyribonuclease RusA